jgi:regulator of sigma E protease
MIYLISFIIALSFVVFVHELGHYLVAKMNKVHVEEFAIGFGSPIFSRKDKSGTVWKIGYIPFGGYVKMQGEDVANGKGEKFGFQGQNNATKIKILLSGPLANYLLGFVIFFFMSLFLGGAGKRVVVVDVAGVERFIGEDRIEIGDVITEINGAGVFSLDSFKKAGDTIAGDVVEVRHERGGEVHNTLVVPKKDEKGHYKIGIVGAMGYGEKWNVYGSIKSAFGGVWSISAESLNGIGQMIIGKKSIKELSGPLRIAQYSGKAMHHGFGMFVNFIAFLSVSLGLMNLLPIPLLDGGQVMFYAVQWVIRRDLPPIFYTVFERVGMAMLASLMIIGMWSDLVVIFKK